MGILYVGRSVLSNQVIVLSICVGLELDYASSSVSPLFKTLYGFDDGQSGMVYTTIVWVITTILSTAFNAPCSVGAFIGLGANVYQDRLYR